MQKLPFVTVFSPATAEHITPRNFLIVSKERVLTTEITVVLYYICIITYVPPISTTKKQKLPTFL
jgi:hypothetical protein